MYAEINTLKNQWLLVKMVVRERSEEGASEDRRRNTDV